MSGRTFFDCDNVGGRDPHKSITQCFLHQKFLSRFVAAKWQSFFQGQKYNFEWSYFERTFVLIFKWWIHMLSLTRTRSKAGTVEGLSKFVSIFWSKETKCYIKFRDILYLKLKFLFWKLFLSPHLFGVMWVRGNC